MTSSVGVGSASDVPVGRASSGEREAILQSLYEERRSQLRMKRSGTSSSGDEDFLNELNRYIDYWEAAEARPTEKDDVWRRLEELAASVLDVQAKVERHRK